MFPSKYAIAIIAALPFLAAPLTARAAGFPDVPADHFAAEAIGFLADRGMLAGYADGTFKPDRKVNRAEALRIIVAPFIPKTENVRVQSADFADVPDNAWYLPSLEWALQKKSIIDGPPKTRAFSPTRPVTKAEFLKMLFAGNGVDPKAFGDITLPLATDVADPGAWFYSALRYAVATATTVLPSSGAYGPARELTRGDVALLLYRYLLYRDGSRSQELLSLTRAEVENVINALAQGRASNAEYASARAVLLARGAREAEPDAPAVKVAVKIAEGFRALVRAYRAGLNGDVNAVLKLAADAEYLAGQAEKMSPDAKAVAGQLRLYARSFKDQAGGKR